LCKKSKGSTKFETATTDQFGLCIFASLTQKHLLAESIMSGFGKPGASKKAVMQLSAIILMIRLIAGIPLAIRGPMLMRTNAGKAT
jgi:hypothetical protein